MTPPLSMIPATSHFQVPMPQMTGAYQQAMFGGQFHGHFPASPQFVSQGYSGGNDQGQQQPSLEMAMKMKWRRFRLARYLNLKGRRKVHVIEARDMRSKRIVC